MFKDKKEMKREGLVMAVLMMALLAASLFIFRDYVFGDRVLVFNDVGGDTWQQYTMQYADVINHLKNGTFATWDFTNGTGINIFNYYMFHPFIWILYLLGLIKGTAHMLLFIVWVMILEILVAGFVFYCFLSQYGFSRSAKFLAAFAYGMSGYLLIWGQHYQFGLVTVYLPLMLIFCEHYIKGKKSGVLFPVTAFFCGLTSVYFSYMILATVGFYMIFRLWAEKGMEFKAGIRRFIGGCLQMLLGIGMSLGIFLPTAMVLTGVSSRLEKDSILSIIRNCLIPYGKEYYSSLLTRLFSSNFQNLQELGGEKFHGYLNYYEDPVVFCSVLAVFLMVQFLILFFRTEDKRRKRAVYAAVAFALVLVLLPLGGIAYNAFSESTNRYTFVLLPFILMAAAWTWDRLLSGVKANIAGVLVTAAGLVYVCCEGYGWSLFREYRINVVVTAVTGIVTAIVLILWNRIPEKKEKKTAGWSGMQRIVVYVLSAAFVINVVSEGGITFQDRIYLRKADTPVEQLESAAARYMEQRNSEDSETGARAEFNQPQSYFREIYRQDLQDALIWLESNDPEFYRVEKDYMSATFAMDSAGQNYRGVSTYNAVMNGNLKEFADVCYPEFYYGDQNKLAYWNIADDNWFGAFMGVRYLLSRDKNLDSSKYKLIQQFAGIYLYENMEPASVARFYDTAVSEESFRKLCSKDTRQELLGQAVAVEDGQNVNSMEEFRFLTEDSEMENSSVTVTIPEKDSRVEASVHAADDGYVQFMIPYENGWELTVDGEKTEILKSDLGFSSCKVSAGDHNLVLTFHAPGLKAGIAGSAVFWILYIVYAVYFMRKKKNA